MPSQQVHWAIETSSLNNNDPADATELEKHLKDAEVLITTPFHPAYMTKERLQKADKLKLVMTAGVGSDHIDLQTAADKGMTVVEVTGVPPYLLLVTSCLTHFKVEHKMC